jgi:hypothetical protein
LFEILGQISSRPIVVGEPFRNQLSARPLDDKFPACGRYAEGLCCANDFEQASGRVFTAAARMIEASPLLAQDARVTSEKITFISTGATIVALPNNYTCSSTNANYCG